MTRYIRANYDCQTNRWQLGKLGLPLKITKRDDDRHAHYVPDSLNV